MEKAPLWPAGKRFAFSVFDDTDLATVQNVSPVYALLRRLGFRTTKSVWPIAGDPKRGFMVGSTCADAEYRDWLLGLRDEGFEIALHDATYHTSAREQTIEALDEFKRIFGQDPLCAATHGWNAEGMYWGDGRVSGTRSSLFRLLTRFKRRGFWRGHIEGDPLFWGDVCRQRIKYYRNFVFRDINTLRACPWMPYHDPARPYVCYWFAATEGGDLRRFNAALSPENQDRLEAEGGACIMYTHFAADFSRQGRVDGVFCRQMERLARKNGWFVPVGPLLDHILRTRGPCDIRPAARAKIEWKWLWHKICVGTT